MTYYISKNGYLRNVLATTLITLLSSPILNLVWSPSLRFKKVKIDNLTMERQAVLYSKRLVYYLKKWVTLSEKRVNLSIQCAIMLKACVVLSTQCLIMFKSYGVMLC